MSIVMLRCGRCCCWLRPWTLQGLVHERWWRWLVLMMVLLMTQGVAEWWVMMLEVEVVEWSC